MTGGLVAALLALALHAAPVPPTPAPPAAVPAANIASAAVVTADAVSVQGTPRQTIGHPCTLWDNADIVALQAQLKTDPVLQQALAGMRAKLDARLTKPLGVPDAGGPPPTREVYRAHSANADAISDLGTLYALTGEAAYGEYAKRLLVAYAKVFANLPHPADWTERRYRSAVDGRLTGQFLEDGFWIARAARGADLVYNLPSWTPAERQAVRDDLFGAYCRIFYHPVIKDVDYVSATHNRSAVCVAAMLMAGYATNNQPLVDLALYGVDGTKEHPTGGVLGTHFTARCIRPDGLWNEGAPAYQLGIATAALMNDAETLWHHGIDLYSHDHGMLKRLLDSSLGLAYPDARMSIAALHDSGSVALLDPRDWFSNEAGMPYEYGYRRYGDPRYLPIIRNAAKRLTMTIHAGPPSLYLPLSAATDTAPRPLASTNFPDVGYGVLRVPAEGGGAHQLLLEFGPSGSHGHPSKLGLDLFASDDVLAPFPGVLFPYNSPLDPAWYWTTLANCALTVDEQSQITAGTLYKYPKGTPNPAAQQTIFAPGTTVGLQRARADHLYAQPIAQDRALFLTASYVADLFTATADEPHRYDLAWHFRGQLSTALPLQAHTFPDPVAPGYSALGDLQRGATDQSWTADIARPGEQHARYLAAGGTATEVFIGAGHFVTPNSRDDERPPTIILRRDATPAATFGSVIDLSRGREPGVRAVAVQGNSAAGYALLRVTTTRGTDLCYAAYRAEVKSPDELQTNALQALVQLTGTSPTVLYCAGGTFLRAAGAALERSEPGLAVYERLPDGHGQLSNPSPTPATITLRLPTLPDQDVFLLDGAGQPGAQAIGHVSKGELTLQLPAQARVLLRAAAP